MTPGRRHFPSRTIQKRIHRLQKEGSDGGTDNAERGDDTASTSGGDGAGAGGGGGVARGGDGTDGGGQGGDGVALSRVRSRGLNWVAGGSGRVRLGRVGRDGVAAGGGNRVGRVTVAASRVAGGALDRVGGDGRALNRVAGSLDGVADRAGRGVSHGGAGRVDDSRRGAGSLNGVGSRAAGAGLDGVTTGNGVGVVVGSGKAGQSKGESSGTHFG